MGCRLPLGGNVIRRSLGAKTIADSVAALARRDSLRAHPPRRADRRAAAAETRSDVQLDRAMLDRYLAMYANEDTLEYPPDARRGVEELFARGERRGVLPPGSAGVEWAP